MSGAEYDDDVLTKKNTSLLLTSATALAQSSIFRPCCKSRICERQDGRFDESCQMSLLWGHMLA
jgi:hypothetical protein